MLERWTRAQLITTGQARAIREAEASESGAARGIPLVAEVIAYVGAILALSAVVFIASRIWPNLHAGAQLGLLALATGLLGAAGWWMRAGGSPVVHRLASVLWFLSAAAMGWLADVVATRVIGLEDGFGLVIGIALLLYAGLLYLLRRSSLQQIAVAGGVVFACAGVSDMAGGDDWFGVLLWAAGAAWIALARAGVLTPGRTAFALGAAGVLAGSEALALEFFESPLLWGLALGLASSAALLYMSVSFGETVLLGFGMGGLFVFSVQIVEEYLGDGLGGPLALFASGIALLIAALVTVRIKNRVKTS
jgi:hypothetical protein